MRVPNWRNLLLSEGILREALPDNQRMAVWLPGSRDGGYQHWKRISNVDRAEISFEQGICATPALLIPIRQPVRGLLGRLLPRFRKVAEDRAWTLPNGEAAEQCGERQNDLVLAWVEDDADPLDEPRIKARWPESKEVRQLGTNLFLVSGIEPPQASPAAEQGPPLVCLRAQAEQALANARQAGDRAREVTALSDLGVVLVREGDARRAVEVLEEALTLARDLGDRTREKDVVGNLGFAALPAGQPQRSLELLNQSLAFARADGDRYAEKIALDRLGLACATLHNPGKALDFFSQALVLARELGDRKHEPELLWYLGIQYAELGQRDQAIAHAQAAVDFLKAAGKPQAAWFAYHLQRYLTGQTSGGLAEPPETGSSGQPGAFLDGSIVAGVWGSQAGSGPGPGLLRMGFSAAKSMAQFLGSAFKTVPRVSYQKRIQTCTACEHHTGVRCRLCGCFTSAKAWMAHEECPIGKWSAESAGRK